ncbi:hypothetical protein ScPMuIL_002818 [Solemya velum]
MAGSWSLPMITPVASGGNLNNKVLYKTLTRLTSDYTDFAKFFILVMDSYNWTDVAFIRSSGHIVYNLQEKTFLPIFHTAGIRTTTVVYTSDVGYKSVLDEASRVSRVFLISLVPDVVHELLMTARRLGMASGDYGMLVIRQFETYGVGDQLFPFRYYNKDPEIIEAYGPVLVTSRRQPLTPLYEEFAATMIRMSEEQYGFIYGNRSLSRFIPEYYNAFLLMGYALNKTINEGKNPFDGNDVISNMWNVSFFGVSRMIAIDDHGDRSDDFSLVDFKENGESEEVARYLGTIKQYELIPGTKVQWPGNGRPPPNTPYCGFLGDEPQCQKFEIPVYVTVIIVFSVILILMGIAGVLIYRRLKFESDLQNLWWRITWDDVLIDAVSKGMSHSRLSCFQSECADTKSRRTQIFTTVAVYKGATVAVRNINVKRLTIGRDVLMQLKQMREINCPNLTKFFGICTDGPNMCILMEYCSRGSLEDILQNDSIKLDKHFKVSLLNDIVEGMTYIHSGPLVCHGRLNSSNCVIDSRFVLKITDYGLMAVRSQQTTEKNKINLLWVAPEHLRTNPHTVVSQQGDVYSFAIVLYEMLTRMEPYDEIDDKHDLIEKIKKGSSPFERPKADFVTFEPSIVSLLTECWHEEPSARPTFRRIRQKLKFANWNTSHKNFFDTLLERMEQYANNLEGLVEERTNAFREEKRKAEALLYHILPKSVADQLKNGETVVPEAYDSVTVYFSDIVGFTNIASESSPMEVVDLLNDLYTCFDDIIDLHEVYKVETIGDAYMVVSGLPVRNGIEHAKQIALLSLSILANVGSFRIRHRPGMTLRARIGLHSGPVCAGVVGRKMPRYCLFGDTVNTASRMESNGEAMMIHMSHTTKNLLDHFDCFHISKRGNIEIKGKGTMTTYWLLSNGSLGVLRKIDGRARSARLSVFLLMWHTVGGLDTYTVAIVMESGIGGIFDLPMAGPAVERGMAKLNGMMEEMIKIEYVRKFIANTNRVCERVNIGTLLAELYYKENIQAIIGPGCSVSVEIAGLMAASWKLPMMTPVATSFALTDKTLYRTLTRLSSDNRALARFLVNVLQSFKWTDVVFIRGKEHIVYNLQENAFLPIFKEAGITVTTVKYTDESNHEAVLKEASRSARVFIISVLPKMLHGLLLTAQRLGMTDGDYVLLVLRQALREQKEDQLYPFRSHNESEYIKAYTSVFVVNRRVPVTPVREEFAASMVKMSLEHYNYSYPNTPVSQFVLEYYHAFLLLGHALNRTMNQGGDVFDGMAVVRNMWNISFEGVGLMVTIDENGEREDDFGLVDFKENGYHEEVANYLGVTKQFKFVPGTKIQWPGNRGPPPNTPYCGFLGNAPHCQLTEFPVVGIVAIVFCVVLIVIGIVGVLLFRKMKFESDLHNLWWKIDWDEVLVINGSNKTSCSRLSVYQASIFSENDTISRRIQNTDTVATYRGATVVIEQLGIKRLTTGRDMLMQLKQLRDVNCPNLASFFGICPDAPHICILMEYCSRGSLLDILQNDSIQLDKDFKVSLLNDIIEGMTYIHSGPLVCHGRLNSSNCVIDSRFVLKITDYGLMAVRSQETDIESRNDSVALWVAPEHLRTNPYTDVSQSGDVYSFAIVFYELVTRMEPYQERDDMKEVFEEVKRGTSPPVRPDVSNIETPIANIISECWQEDASARPRFRSIRQKLKSVKITSQKNFFDTLLQRMEQYANNLEGLVEERTTAFLDEKKKAEALLYHILPKSVADLLKNGKDVQPEAYDSVTVYFSDIVGFTNLASGSSPMEVVDLLNDLYICFDDIIDNHDVYKVETIGDAYMVVSGLPTRNGTEHAREIARLALAILQNIGNFKIRHRPELTLRARIGLHSGPVCAGVVGRKMPRFCLFGDTVNTASRMESNGEGEGYDDYILAVEGSHGWNNCSREIICGYAFIVTALTA